MTAEQRILAWLERADFDGTGCRHSQATIAKAVGCSREHVNRCTKALGAQGRIGIEKERRPGLKWPCNVYHVHAWNPHKRSGVLGVLEAIRASHQASCHTEGTAKPSRAQPPLVTSFLDEKLKDQRCGRARGPRTKLRSGRVCEDCGRLLEENKQLLAHLREGTCASCAGFMTENAELTQEISGLMHTTRHQARSIAGLTSELRKTQNTDPAAAEIEVVLANWKHHTGHPKAKTPVGGKRWVTVKKALKDHSLEELLEAIEGLALVPYVGKTGRKVSGNPNERYDDVEHALGDETKVARFRGYRARAAKASSDALFVALEELSATNSMYASTVLAALARENRNGNGAPHA